MNFDSYHNPVKGKQGLGTTLSLVFKMVTLGIKLEKDAT